MTQAMMTKGASRAPTRAVSSFPIWCKGSKRRREHQAKAPVSVQQDQDQSNGREEVIVEPKPVSPPEPLAGEDQLLSGRLVLVVPLQTCPPLLAPFPLDIWEEDQGLYK